MPGWIAGGIAAAGLVGDIFSSNSQQQTNAMSADQAAQNRTFQAQQQQQVEDWETNMANTSMQRRVTDLKAAGLNPALAVGQGGAAVPSVSPASGSMPSFANPGSAFQNLGQIAASSAQTAAQVANTNAQTAKTISETPTPRYVNVITNPDGSQEVQVNATAGHELGDQQLASAQAAVELINANLHDPGGAISVGQAQQKLTEVLEQKGELDLETAKQIQSGLIKATNANNKLDTITATSGQKVMGAQAAGQNAGTWIEALRLIIGASKGH